jgi:hypothetical protein
LKHDEKISQYYETFKSAPLSNNHLKQREGILKSLFEEAFELQQAKKLKNRESKKRKVSEIENVEIDNVEISDIEIEIEIEKDEIEKVEMDDEQIILTDE